MTRQAPRPQDIPIGRHVKASWKGAIHEFFSGSGPLTLERVSWRMMCASCGRGTRLLFRWNEFLAWRRCRRCLMGGEVLLVMEMVLEMRARV